MGLGLGYRARTRAWISDRVSARGAGGRTAVLGDRGRYGERWGEMGRYAGGRTAVLGGVEAHVLPLPLPLPLPLLGRTAVLGGVEAHVLVGLGDAEDAW